MKRCVVPAEPKARIGVVYINDYVYRNNTALVPLGKNPPGNAQDGRRHRSTDGRRNGASRTHHAPVRAESIGRPHGGRGQAAWVVSKRPVPEAPAIRSGTVRP